jgi:hypothetical protein
MTIRCLHGFGCIILVNDAGFCDMHHATGLTDSHQMNRSRWLDETWQRNENRGKS